MPEEWNRDTLRREKCNIPKDEKHLSKPTMAQKMIEDAQAKGIDFDFVNFDALYGNTTSLLAFLESKNIDFIGDIRSNFIVHFDYGKEEDYSVDQYLNYLSAEDFEQIDIRQSTKGRLKAYFHYVKVQV
ncbi:MAG: transposase, partial [Bacteroidota bacterium]